MITIKNLGSYLIVCSMLGALLCAYHNGWIIICLPGMYKQNYATHLPITSSRQKATLTWWNNNRWQTETAEIVCPIGPGGCLETLTQKWLALVDEEKPDIQKTKLQTALFSEKQKTAYLSFDRNPLDKHASMYDKLALIESLFLTLKNNGLPCAHVQLLVHHKPLVDPHLDCSVPWPITGFCMQRDKVAFS